MTEQEKLVQELKEELKEFLEKHPKHKLFQQVLDSKLSKIGSKNNRMVLSFDWMVESLEEFKNLLNKVAGSNENNKTKL